MRRGPGSCEAGGAPHRGERRGGVEAQGALRRSKEVVDRHSDELKLARAEGGQAEAAGESDAEDEAGERAGGADGEVDAARVGALARSDLLGELEHRANLWFTMNETVINSE